MINMVTSPTIEHPFQNVKTPVNTQLPLIPEPVIHHKGRDPRTYKIVSYTSIRRGIRYGVSSAQRILPPGVFNKRFDQIVHCLRDVVSLPTCEREAALRLLTLGVYYGNVYPKASQIASEKGCSKATFWRTVVYLKHLGLIRVIPRFIIRPHAQISNLYRLDKLLLMIVRYLAEHGCPFSQKWLRPALRMPGYLFWPWILSTTGSSPGLSGCCTA